MTASASVLVADMIEVRPDVVNIAVRGIFQPGLEIEKQQRCMGVYGATVLDDEGPERINNVSIWGKPLIYERYGKLSEALVTVGR